MSRVSWAVRRCFHSGIDRHRAHVVQPVGELDDEHPPVLRHRDEHLAHRRRLLGLLGVELQPVELGDPVDDGGDLGPELLGDVVEGEPGVLDGVVEEGRGHRPGVEPRSATMVATATGWVM